MRMLREAILPLCIGLSSSCDSDGIEHVVRPAERVAAPVPDAPEGIYHRSFAVVVGIDAYETLDRLGGAVRDARAMAKALAAQGFEVTMLLDGDATQQRVREVLGDRLPQQLGPDDRVLIYFAGHGVSVGAEGSETGYLMPVGGLSYSPVATGISMTELGLWFDRYPSKHVMFLADACYSGLAIATRSMALVPSARGYLGEIAKRRVRFTLVAGDATQEAHEWGSQGVFTRFVLEAMGGNGDANGDRLVTSDELSSYVKPRVAELVQARFQASQLPVSGRSGTGEFVFYVDTSAAPAAQAPVAVAVAPKQPELPKGVEPKRDVKLEPIGIWRGPEGHSLRIQREGAKTIVIGSTPEDRFVLGMIGRGENTARFEGAGRVLAGPERGRFFQLDAQIAAIDPYTVQVQATRQPLDGFGQSLGSALVDEMIEFRREPAPVHTGPNLEIEGEWQGGENRKASIHADGDAAVMSCTDRWGSFTARTRHWVEDEAVFEGYGEFTRERRPFRIAVRLSAKSEGVLSYEPVIQYVDEDRVPLGASLLGYTWTLERAPDSASVGAPSATARP